MTEKTRSTIAQAGSRLRELARAADEGALLGSEDELVEKLDVARVTLKQAARLLEREGLVQVRRGINGGYFAARPSVEMIVNTVSAYLDTVELDTHHASNALTAIWIEIVREAACADRTAARSLAKRLFDEVMAMDPDTPAARIARFEEESREQILELIDGKFLQLIIRIVVGFSRLRVSGRTLDEELGGSRRFVQAWRTAKLQELEAIAAGDQMLAMMAAYRLRKVWESGGASVWGDEPGAADARR